MISNLLDTVKNMPDEELHKRIQKLQSMQGVESNLGHETMIQSIDTFLNLLYEEREARAATALAEEINKKTESKYPGGVIELGTLEKE